MTNRDGIHLDAVPSPALLVEGDGTIAGVNEQFSTLLGRRPARLANSLEGLVADGHLPVSVPREFRAAVTRTESGGESASFLFPVVLDTGERVEYTARVSGRSGDGVHTCILTPVDETRVESARLVESLNGAARAMFTATEPATVFETATRTAYDVLGFPATATRRYVPERDVLTVVSHAQRTGEVDGPDRAVHDSPHGEAFRTGETVVSDGTSTDDPHRHEGFTQTVHVPIGEYGTLSIGKEAGTVTPTERRCVEVVARGAAAALDDIERTARLRDRDQRLNAFSKVLTHDLRNTLTIANGYLRALDGDQRFLEEIDDALGRIEEVTEDLRLIARRGRKEQFTELTLDRVKDSVDSAFQRTVAEPEDIDVEVLEWKDHLRCDPMLFTRLVQAIVEEAYDTASGPETETPRPTPTVRIALDDEEVHISSNVSIFEHVRTTNGASFDFGHGTTTEGSGFQTATIGGIAELHGWRIEYSTSTDDTDFHFVYGDAGGQTETAASG